MAIIAGGGRYRQITVADDENQIELGVPSPQTVVGTWLIQLVDEDTFSGSITIQGRAQGQPDAPLVNVPYVRVNLAGTASDYTVVTAALTGAAIIQVPANGMSIALDVDATSGTLGVYSWALNGPITIAPTPAP